MKLFNRDSIANDIKFKVFAKKKVWDLIFDDTRESVNFVIRGGYTNRRLFEKMNRNVSAKVNVLGGQLKETYITVKGRRKVITYENAEEVMEDVIRKQLSVTFKIMVRNKYYEFTVGN